MRDEFSIQFDEDVGLMVKAREGDHSAYEKLYCRYYRTVVSFLAHRKGSHQGCEDLAQEVFVRVWCRRRQYQPLASVRSYLLGVAINILREDRAKFHRGVSLESHDLEAMPGADGSSPSSQAQSAEQLQAVRVLMASLPTRQRQAAELVYLAGLAPEEAAERLACPLQTLYSHLSAAREKLRKLARPSQKK